MASKCTFLPDDVSTDDIFSVLEGVSSKVIKTCMTKSRSSFGASQDVVVNEEPKSKRVKVSHIAVERNRRKQMNEHLSVLRSLLPCFYVKRGDQASIIEGVASYITELQQVLQSLEAKKQRKVYSELVTTPKLVSSPRTIIPLSPQNQALGPSPSLPISPRTPQPLNPFRPILPQFISPSLNISPATSVTNSDSANEIVANLRSSVAEVEVKFSSGNLVLTTCSNRIPGKVTKVVDILEKLSLEVLQANINVIDDIMVNSFTIKIGVGCPLSAEELAQHIQQTFC
ncbi:transcription factor SPEECHLESS-like [Rutidosis leptorrhynchoides]|uniref:transcription factor SPEECHLESS-like n=1 Tax=Rutidosis leptorrhynchoides TaxID=125765 RepID=UPI003A99949E